MKKMLEIEEAQRHRTRRNKEKGRERWIKPSILLDNYQYAINEKLFTVCFKEFKTKKSFYCLDFLFFKIPFCFFFYILEQNRRQVNQTRFFIFLFLKPKKQFSKTKSNKIVRLFWSFKYYFFAQFDLSQMFLLTKLVPPSNFYRSR